MLGFIITVVFIGIIVLPLILFGALAMDQKDVADVRARLPEILDETFNGDQQVSCRPPRGMPTAEFIEAGAARGYDLVHTITETYSTTLVFERRG